MNLIEKAYYFASAAHDGQTRKYTHEPYVTHPVAVAGLMIVHDVDPSDEMVAAAILHDTIEDTPVTESDILNVFGSEVAELVVGLTNVTTLADGNRAVRKEIELARLVLESADVQTIKVADLMHNATSIAKYDKGFWKVFRGEMIENLNAMTKANPVIVAAAWNLLNELEFV